MTRVACLFDIDGTLIHSHGAGIGAFCDAMSQTLGRPCSAEGITFHGQTDRSIAAQFFARHSVTDVAAAWAEFLPTYLGSLPASLQQRPGTVLPGVVPLLEHLRRQPRVLLGVLTGNVQVGAQIKLTHYQLSQYFDFGGFGDLHHDRNDVARHALQAAQQHANGAAIHSVWVIGDTANDIRCGRAIGARCLALPTGGEPRHRLVEQEPDLLLEDLVDPNPWLKQLGIAEMTT